MYLAPLNYDRYFKKIFSDPKIAQCFLEDFLEVKIEDLEILPMKHHVTDRAALVEFDFRCKINGAYLIIDMQQWYKADVIHRFYLYHALNTSLQLENLPKKTIAVDEISKKAKKVKDYSKLEPVFTLIWMVHDNLKFENNYVSYGLTPQEVLDFVQKDQLWHNPEVQKIQEEREKVLQLLNNSAKNINFLAQNRLVFAFQKNIIGGDGYEKYHRWFNFAEKTQNEENTEEDFKEFEGDKIFEEMMRRLNHNNLTKEDFEYIKTEKEFWVEYKRMEENYYQTGKNHGKEEGYSKGKEEGKKEGMEKGIKKGMEKGMEKGKEEEKLEIAKKLLHFLDDKTVAENTGLSLEKIQHLRNSLPN